MTLFNDPITKRISPLFVSTFFSGLVFWYAVEKLFMTELGFSNSGIILATTVLVGSTLLLEIPSGVLADRWSRKGVLIIAHTALSLSALVGFLSQSPAVFLISMFFWGAYYAFNSGAVESITYDILLEDTGSRKGFEKHYGRTRSMISVSLILGALFGGAITSLFDARTTFLLSAPIALLGIPALLSLREPKLHKLEVAPSVGKHIRESIAILKSKRIILYIAGSSILAATVSRFLFEYYQIWLVTLSVSVVYYGFILALLNSSFAIAGFVGHRLTAKPFALIGLSIITLISSFGLAVHWAPLVIAATMACIIMMSINSVLLSGLLHDQLRSSQRSSVSSAIGSCATIVFILSAFAASYATSFSIFWTVPIVIVLILGGLMSNVYIRKENAAN